jgi:hypothetical protein
MKYVKLRYPNGREYTYHTDDDVTPGDFCTVLTNQGASLDLEVTEVLSDQPAFQTKSATKVNL